MFKLLYIFGHVLTVNNGCYGRCYLKKFIPLCPFLKFNTYLEVNSARLIQNTFYKCSRALNLTFLRNCIFLTSSFFRLSSHLNSDALFPLKSSPEHTGFTLWKKTIGNGKSLNCSCLAWEMAIHRSQFCFHSRGENMRKQKKEQGKQLGFDYK